MKKWIAVLLAALLALSLIVCGKGNSIVGTWELDSGVGEEAQQAVALMKAFGMSMSITFKADGTGSLDYAYGGEVQTTSFSYTYEDGALKLTSEDGEEADTSGMNFKVEDGKLIMEQEGMGLVFKKK